MSKRSGFEDGDLKAFRSVPRTGVIYVMTEARRRGHGGPGPERWVNFGQGQPEIGELAGAPARIRSIAVHEDSLEYAPVAGLGELREAIAAFYNRSYRRGMKSQYSAENVAISAGGRAGLTRVVAALAPLNLGHFLPDYTAYEELLGAFHGFTPIPILLEPERAYEFSLQELHREIAGRGLGALLLSNPCNPMGKLIHGEELNGWVATARDLHCTLILDEFYSRYVWEPSLYEGATTPPQISAAAHVEDVNKDPVVILDGLTKNWRYPGWRISWTVGPKSVIDAISSAGSFLDGGACHPMQKAALPLLSPEHCLAEAQAIQNAFRPKRQLLLDGLRRLGVEVEREPEGTFYVWGNLRGLPTHLATGMGFFDHALSHQLITVPGQFFDVNPGGRRYGRHGRFHHHLRFSFGPPMADIKEGLARIEAMIKGG